MDVAQLAVLAHAAETVLGVLICLGTPAVIIFTLKHFKLRHREIELEAELHGKQTQTRLDSIEARLGIIESALGVIARNPAMLDERRREMLDAPAPAADEPGTSQSQPVRTR
jgi:hypothetical protein